MTASPYVDSVPSASVHPHDESRGFGSAIGDSDFDERSSISLRASASYGSVSGEARDLEQPVPAFVPITSSEEAIIFFATGSYVKKVWDVATDVGGGVVNTDGGPVVRLGVSFLVAVQSWWNAGGQLFLEGENIFGKGCK